MPAAVNASAVVDNAHSRAVLHAEAASVAGGERLWVALELTPIAGWHLYWQNPGDSGMETHLDWTLPAGWRAGEPLYPTPGRLPAGPLVNYGYENAATLLIPIDTAAIDAGAETIALALEAEWLVCDVECIPEYGRFSLTLPVGDGGFDAAAAPIFAKARAALPTLAEFPADFMLSRDEFSLIAYLLPDEMLGLESVHFFPHVGDLIDYAADQWFEATEAGLRLRARRSVASSAPDEVITGVLVLDYANAVRRSYRIEALMATMAPVQTGEAAATADENAPLSLLTALAFAFVGGLLLNIMPCVFPILSLKAIALSKLGAGDGRGARQDAAAYLAGVLVSFWSIALLLVGLKAAGQFAGWGFQLQSPLFVAVMAIVMLLTGLNLSGWFEVGAGFQALAGRVRTGTGQVGAFLTGMLAVAVATPCTAPLMAPALGFAVTQPAGVILAVLTSLGVGLATPYLLLALSPAVRRRLPKPGAWMETAKQILAFPLYLTAAWLISVLAEQSGGSGLLATFAAMIALCFAIWLTKTGRGRVTGTAAAMIAIAATGALFIYPFAGAPAGQAMAGDAELVFSRGKLAALRAEDRPVFAYFTADWCITCKVNERVALQTDAFKSFVAREDIAILVGDWTNRDDEIASVLADFSRNGVPLYVFYPPGGAEPIVLPQLLTSDLVIDRLGSVLS